MKTLDLHGIKHEDVEKVLTKFINQNFNKKMKIITGKSNKMKFIVCAVIEEYDLQYRIGDMTNNGYITIYNHSEET